MSITPSQCRAARAMLGQSQPQLAELSGLGLSTIVDFERSRRGVAEGSIQQIRRALEQAGIQFVADGETAAGVGVVLRR